MTGYLIGIDPGVTTGYAVKKDGRFIDIGSGPILAVMQKVLHFKSAAQADGGLLQLRFEDARLRMWFGAKGREALQGAGSIKRDCAIWEEFCLLYNIRYLPIRPAKGGTKWDAVYFAKVIGWTGRTNEHGRDAALLVI